jgi:hypothetical protein
VQIRHGRLQRPADDERRQRAESRRLHLVAAADREREAVTPVAVLGVSYRVAATMPLDRAA